MTVSSYKEILLKNRVKEVRINKGYSQTDLAILCGTTQTTISQIETEVYYPTYKLALAISIILDEEIDYLFYNGDKGKWRYEHSLKKIELQQRKEQ